MTFTAAPGTSEFIKRWQPKIGDIVSFKHKGFLSGSKRPLSPSLYRLRPDLTWEDVVTSWKDDKPRVLSLYPCSGYYIVISFFLVELTRRRRLRNKAKRYWQSADNRRDFFCDTAKKMGFDPLVVANWQYFKVKHLAQHVCSACSYY